MHRAARLGPLALAVLALLPLWAATPPAHAQDPNDPVVEAREALRKKDLKRLVALRQSVVAARHPLAMWVDYWEIGTRLADVQQPEVDAFYERWRHTYVEDRFRNDWLLELGRRRDWVNFAKDHPAFRMQDDREVACYALLLRQQAGQDVKTEALEAWYAQRDLDDGCHLLAQTLNDAKALSAADVWHEVGLSVQTNRVRAARGAAELLGPETAKSVAELIERPARFLKQNGAGGNATQRELTALALLRLAASDPDDAAAQFEALGTRRFEPALAARIWAGIGRQAAWKLSDRAFALYQQAWKAQSRLNTPPRWGDDVLAWSARAALRGAPMTRDRWALLEQSISAMSVAEQADATWIYWKARALLAQARPGEAGQLDRATAQALFNRISGQLNFYGHLASHELEQPFALPAAPAPFTDAETAQAAQTPGLQRGLQLAQLGLRDEGRREWNYTLRGLNDRALLAAAQMACQARDWQLCINTSERTREVADVRQRYPLPWRSEITAQSRERGLDPALVFGLIRQETRFMHQLKSSAGAMGLMQLMPRTAQWTARKIGLDLKRDQITDVDTNLALGTSYLKMVLDDFAGSQPMATAAYNAGPGRPRRWRDGPPLEPAAWAENIPFNETRDYVKKVLGNAVIYSHLLELPAPPTLKARLGPAIGPREAGAAAPDGNLP